MTDLKPCPFCGCKVYAKKDIVGNINFGWMLSGEHREDCIMRHMFLGCRFADGDVLIEMWNKRMNE